MPSSHAALPQPDPKVNFCLKYTQTSAPSAGGQAASRKPQAIIRKQALLTKAYVGPLFAQQFLIMPLCHGPVARSHAMPFGARDHHQASWACLDFAGRRQDMIFDVLNIRVNG